MKQLLTELLSFNLVRVDSPLLCGEEDKLQAESLGSGADLLPYPVRLRRGPLIGRLTERELTHL